MTLAEIVQECREAYGARFQCTEAVILRYINTIQQVAFNRDLLAFLWWENFLTVYQEITLAAGATACVASDVGRVVTNGSVTGTLRSFNNTKRTLLVETSGTFSGAITITSGTGAGTFSAQAVAKGPYSWASLYPEMGSLTAYTQNGGVRKMVGLTKLTDLQLLKPSQLLQEAILDYNFLARLLDDRAIYEKVRKYDMQQALTFVDTPDTEAETYRWVYFFRPPTINAALAADNANLLLPAEFHHTVIVEGVGILADKSVYGGRVPEEVFEPIMKPFWDWVMASYTPSGDGSDFTSAGTL